MIPGNRAPSPVIHICSIAIFKVVRAASSVCLISGTKASNASSIEFETFASMPDTPTSLIQLWISP